MARPLPPRGLRRAALPLLLAAGACAAPPPPQAFVVAHPDDWQLFMGDVAVRTLADGADVTFVVLSAGGMDRPAAYWRARERGAVQSMVTAVRLAGVDGGARTPACAPWTVRGTVVHRCRFGPAVSVFLRLPDGRPDGRGFPPDSQSLAKLGSLRERGIAAVDGSARHRDWPALAAVVRAVLTDDGRRAPPTLHTHDPDRGVNPVDHADHRATGLLVLELARGWGRDARAYEGYTLLRRVENLPERAMASKAALFATYDRTRMAADPRWGAWCDNPVAHAAYLFRTYARTVATSLAR